MKKKSKGKGNLSDKVKNANITDWVDHKLHKASFIESLKGKFINLDEIQNTYGEYSKQGNFPEDYWSFEEGEQKKKIDGKAFDQYGSELSKQYAKMVKK